MLGGLTAYSRPRMRIVLRPAGATRLVSAGTAMPSDDAESVLATIW